MQTLTLNPSTATCPIPGPSTSAKSQDPPPSLQASLPGADPLKASLYFIGTATTILQWNKLRILTDPNFLHAGDHVHLGPGVTGTRRTDPALELEQLPPIDMILLSHYHGDHFDQEVEKRLTRDLPIVTTPHAKGQLERSKDERSGFEAVTAVDTWESVMVDVEDLPGEWGERQTLKITAMPGKHVPPHGILEKLNDLASAVPPTNGWMLEFGMADKGKPESFACGYRVYITGDTLLIDELHEIPKRYAGLGLPVNLMLMHLGGTTIPGPSMPLLMVTMDAKNGVELMQLVKPERTIPIHYDDYDVFLSSLDDFQKEVEAAGLREKVVYLDRGDHYKFELSRY